MPYLSNREQFSIKNSKIDMSPNEAKGFFRKKTKKKMKDFNPEVKEISSVTQIMEDETKNINSNPYDSIKKQFNNSDIEQHSRPPTLTTAPQRITYINSHSQITGFDYMDVPIKERTIFIGNEGFTSGQNDPFRGSSNVLQARGCQNIRASANQFLNGLEQISLAKNHYSSSIDRAIKK